MALASSTSGDQHFFEIVTLCKPPTYQDWGRARAAGNRFARDVEELVPQLEENNYPESGLVKLPRRDTRTLSPAGMFGGKASLRLAAQKKQTARAISAYAQYACLLSSQMGSMN